MDTTTSGSSNPLILWRPRRDSNPCYRRERAMSWASRRRGRGRLRAADPGRLLPKGRASLHAPGTADNRSLADPRKTGRIWLQSAGRWWSQAGSNRRPLACHASALPAELWPHEGGEGTEAARRCQARKTAPAAHLETLRCQSFASAGWLTRRERCAVPHPGAREPAGGPAARAWHRWVARRPCRSPRPAPAGPPCRAPPRASRRDR